MSFVKPAGWVAYDSTTGGVTFSRANHSANYNDLTVLRRSSNNKATPTTSKYALKYLMGPLLTDAEGADASSPDMIMDWSLRNVASRDSGMIVLNATTVTAAMAELSALLVQADFIDAVLDNLGFPS